jgi:hypothetical protein
MRQRRFTSRTAFNAIGWETKQGGSPSQMEQVRSRTGLLAPIEPCQPKPSDGLRLVWLRAILCIFFLDSWFKLHDAGAEDGLPASPVPHRFARAGLDHAAASQEMATSPSSHLMGESGLLGSGSPTDLPRSRTEFDLSWRSPWPYLSLVLLAWLLLL